jgi:hypothetical protein
MSQADCPSEDSTFRHCGKVSDWSDCEKCEPDYWCFRVTCPVCLWSSVDCEDNA